MRPCSDRLAAMCAKSDPEHHAAWLPFWMHAMDAAGIMKRLVQDWLPTHALMRLSAMCGGTDAFIALAVFCALTHDIGKVTALFQHRIAAAMGNSPTIAVLPLPTRFIHDEKSPHALAGEAILREYQCPAGIASVVGAHHGRPAEGGVADQLRIYYDNYYGTQKDREIWTGMWAEWIDFALQESGVRDMKNLPDIPMPAQVVLCGLLIVADWVASNPAYFPLIPLDKNGSLADYPERVDRAWVKLAFPEPWRSCAQFGMSDADFCNRFGFSPNPMQHEVLNQIAEAHGAGIYILEAPMGIGKTEAALAGAEILAGRTGAGGLFFGLPTQATSNGIFPRLESWAAQLANDDDEVHSIRLVHSAAELNDDYRALLDGHANLDDESVPGLIVHDWLSGRKQALLSDFVIGTVDQLLLAALKQKHVMLRHLGLVGKVVVIDECHAYDAYMNQYLDRALTWLGVYQVPVILLSATLPAQRRAEMVASYLGVKSLPDDAWQHTLSYPLLTYTDGSSVRQQALPCGTAQTTVRILPTLEPELIDCVRRGVSCGGCVGVIVNTVKKAQEKAALLRTAFPQCEVLVLHAQFVATDRAAREKALIARVGKHSAPETRRGVIVVGTQVLEQSLDIDFDLMITELCPMDLLLQRIGRLHRHPRVRPAGLENAQCGVMNLDGEIDPGSCAVYGPWLLMRTRALLPDQIALPHDIPTLVQKTYDFDDVGMLKDEIAEAENAKNKYKLSDEKKKGNAKVWRISAPKTGKRSTLDGWLNDCAIIGEAYAEKAVRDGNPSVDVIAVRLDSEGCVHPVSAGCDFTVPTDRPPSLEEALQIARQKLRLPGFFGAKWQIDDVVDALEADTRRCFSEWQFSSLLKEELVLVFDDEGVAHIGETTLRYDPNDGLTYQKE